MADTLDGLSAVIGRPVNPVAPPEKPKKEAASAVGVLDDVSKVIGRPVKQVAPASAATPPPLDSVLGRKVEPQKLDPLVSSRVNLYSEAVKNKIDPKTAIKTAMAEGVAMTPDPSNWRKITSAIGRTPTGTGKTFGDLGNTLSEAWDRAWSNPMGVSDEEWEKDQKSFNEFIDKQQKKFGPGPFSEFTAGAYKGAFKFAGEQASPGQIALMIGTFGESALVRAGTKLGIEGAPAVARTVSKLMQVQFAAGMAEGAVAGTNQAIDAARKGDWQAAGESAVEGLVSGVMAHGLMSHEIASERVHRDLDATAQEKHGVQFNQLDPYRQGEVIHDTVRKNPAYKAVVDQTEAKNKETVRKAQDRITDYHDRAINESWDANIARRTVRNIDRSLNRRAVMDYDEARQNKLEDARQHYLKQIVSTLKTATERGTAAAETQRQEEEQARQEGREARPARQAEEREKKAVIFANSKQTEAARASAADIREKADREQVSRATTVKRPVNAQQSDAGHIAYQANYYGETNSFGLAGDVDHLGVYRETPRGVEYLNKDGFYTEDTSNVYIAPNAETGDTVAQLSSLRHEAESSGDFKEETYLSTLQREVVAGEKTAAEARKEAGMADKAELPTEVDALRAGDLAGPLAGKTETEFYSDVADQAEQAGFGPEETEELLKQAGVMARAETENNLHHVARSGDYITSKKDVRWTLDSRGMMHPDDGGAPFPLMKNGRYSNQALQLAQSGRVGYAGRSREQRRADVAKQRSIKAMIDTIKPEISDAIDHVLKVAQQNVGLEQTPENLPSEGEGAKKERAKGFGPPDPQTAQAKQSAIGIAALIRDGLEKSGAAEVVDAIAKENGVDAEEVLRQKLAKDDSPEGKAASLEVGDKITDPFRKDRPWVVEQSPSGGLQLRSGNANPLKLDRMNPSPRVLDLIKGGALQQERPYTDQDVEHVAFESPHAAWVDQQVEQVRAIQNGQKVPEPKSPAQAKAQAVAAERRTEAAVSKATETQKDALEPPPSTTVEQADKKAEEAESDIKTAQAAQRQEAEAFSKTVPPNSFPPRAPIWIEGLRGNADVIVQNGDEMPIHYEMVRLESPLTSHEWQGNTQIEREGYPESLQPRTISEKEALENVMRSRTPFVDEDGVRRGYQFRNYSDRTIAAATGPSLLDSNGYVVSGNTRLEILRRYVANLQEIQDPIEREVALSQLRIDMASLARDTGITPPPPADDGIYVVTRVLDKPIADAREAARLGRLFNKPISVQMSEAAKGVSYSKSLSDENLSTLGRLIEDHDGLNGAIAANPGYFSELVTNNFGIVPEEFEHWFKNGRNSTLNDQGESQFSKALLGTVFKDTSVLNQLTKNGPTAPYRALERALSYILKMRAIPDRDLTPQIIQAVEASADTLDTDATLSNIKDKWAATYRPDQVEFLGMETERPPEPNRMIEVIWRAMNAGPRTLNDRLKNWIGEESASNESMFAVHETPAEIFSRVFRKELKESAWSHKEEAQPEISEAYFDSLKRNIELSEEARKEAQRAEEGKPPKKEKKPEKPTAKPVGFTPPPSLETKAPATPDAKIAEAKAEKGYVTAGDLTAFLQAHPSTKEHVPEIMRTAQMMAEYVFDSDPPEGVDRKEALDWILKERVAKLEAGGKGRGSYSDPLVEKGIGTGILKLSKAADETTFIHEFAHVIFPMLSAQDHWDLNTIHHEKYPQWDQTTPLRGDAYKGLSEKLALGLEKFLRDANPTGFSADVKKVLAKVKEMFRQAYLRFRGDPLNNFELTDEAKGVFANMFHIEDLDIPDSWREEVKKAKSEGKGFTPPGAGPHPVVKIAQDMGAVGLRKAFSGKVEETVGDRVDPKKPTAVLFYPNEEAAKTAWLSVGTEGSKIENAELIAGEDGTYGIRFNTAAKIPQDVLYQEIPRKNPGIELEEIKAKLAKVPATAPLVRKLYEKKIADLENEIRSKYGAEERKPVETKQEAQEAVKEAKNAARTVPDLRGLPKAGVGDLQRRGIGEVPKYAILGRSNDAGTRPEGGPLPGTRTLTAVKAVNLQPQADRGTPVGILDGQKFEAKEWLDGLKKAGLPENAPPPTVPISRETSAQLKYAGQKQIVQMAMSALDQGDGFVISSATGSGKTYTSMGVVKEFMNANPGAKVLVITKNIGLLKNSGKVGKESFGFDMNSNVPKTVGKGVYGATYQRLLGNEIYKQTDWDLVVADESGEMRNWFREENQQGKAGMEVIDKAKKAVYVSATPFHSPAEYGYVKKLNLWPKNGFDKWIAENFAHEKIGDKVVAKLDPAKQAKLRQQLIERGQFVSQQISYDGFTTHFGVVPIGDDTRRSLNRIHEGIARAKANLVQQGKSALATRLSAFEATYTKAFLERSRLPQAIELTKKALAAGWHPLIFSETTSEDLFRREEDGEPGTYRKLDQDMGGELSRIIPPFPNVFGELKTALGGNIADYSGSDNTDAARESAKQDYLSGRVRTLYTTYAAGGIGISLHDELGTRPRLSIFLGPPYSGVLLEQAMGRTWRFGVKSNARAVFLATDSEPDIRLMATKVGPRMRAVRASVLGERDALGAVMGSYSDEEKLRERQDMLAYDQGNEVKVDAQSFQQRSKRNVDIDNWASIEFPNAETAKNKGMQVQMAGKDGDWATMYQSNFRKGGFNRLPPTLGELAAQRKLNETAEAIAKGTGLPPGDPQLSMDPSERETAAGAAAAIGASAQDVPVERDKGNAGKMAAEAMYRPGWRIDDDGVWRKEGFVERTPNGMEPPPMKEDVKTDWGLVRAWALSSETAIRSIARQAGKSEAGDELVRMQRDYVQMIEKHYADYANELGRIAADHKLDLGDEKVMRELFSVVQGKTISKDQNINKAAEEIADLNEIVHGDLSSADVKLQTPKGETLSYKGISADRNYMPHRIDWDAQIEDPLTKEVATLKEIMGKTFSQAKRERMLQEIAAEMKITPEEVADYLNQMKKTPPIFGHIQRARTIDFPIYKQDLSTMMRYYEQAASAIAREKVFGDKLGKLNAAVGKIPSENGRTTIHDLFAQNFRQQDWNTTYGKVYNRIAALEIFTKMNWSAIKVPFHLANVPLALGGRPMPLARAVVESILNRKEFKENTAMAGTIIRQVNPLLLMDEAGTSGAAHWILKKEGFEAAYRWGRGIAGSTARVYMEQYAMDALKKGGSGAEETRRILKDRMLVTDAQIDEAIRKGQFSHDALQTAQRSFANFTMFSERNPLQMPQLARLDTSSEQGSGTQNFHRAVRLTYLLQSFAVKFHSLVKETVYDEVVKHGNYKPLAYLMLTAPILGQMLKGAASAIPSGVHRGMEQATGSQHKQDSWDRYLEQFKALYGDHPLAAAMKIYVDGMAAQTALDMMRTMADPFLELAEGNAKKARSEFEYLPKDMLEDIIGPGWSSVTVNMLDLVTGEAKALMAPEAKQMTDAQKTFVRWLENEVPSIKLIPGMETGTKKKAERLSGPAF